MITVVRLVILLEGRRQKHGLDQGNDCDFIMTVAGSQIALLQPGYQVKLHILGFNCVDELPLNKLPEWTAFT